MDVRFKYMQTQFDRCTSVTAFDRNRGIKANLRETEKTTKYERS